MRSSADRLAALGSMESTVQSTPHSDDLLVADTEYTLVLFVFS